MIRGMAGMAVRFSRCCAPVPGDEIVGFVTRGRGVSVHRTDCINIINLSDEEREVGQFMVEIKIFGNNRTGLLVDITKILTERQIDITAIHSNTSKQGIATITLAFETKGKEELTSLISKIRQVESVIDIERTRG